MFLSITAPTIIFADSPASSSMILVASSISCNVMFSPPVIFTSTPCAPAIDALSRRGLDIACWAANAALSSPCAVPVPIIASPMFFITVSTSAKSKFIIP